MTEADIKKMLGGFKVKQNKARHMEKVVADLERQLQKAEADAAEEAAMPRAMVIDGMPRGTSAGDPTGQIGAALADGKVRDEEVERLMIYAQQPSITSLKLWVGMFVAIPTAIPLAPFTSRFGKRQGNTTGSLRLSSKLFCMSTVSFSISRSISSANLLRRASV